VVWFAYCRWAALRGEMTGDGKWWAGSGWLAKVPVLAERRGSAPATLAALKTGTQGSVDNPVGTSVGAHAVTRTLPVGLCLDWYPGLAAGVAALTHVGEAVTAASTAAELINRVATGVPLAEAAPQELAAALNLAHTHPGDAAVLRRFAPDGTARSALKGGIYAAAAAHPDRVKEALVFAASAPDGGHAAVVAGALIGAIHGPACLPVDWVSRLELAWVGDTLARDLVQQVTEGPAGGEYEPATDPTWWNRYPGS
jgi:ADP-ribosylglycohydrolase